MTRLSLLPQPEMTEEHSEPLDAVLGLELLEGDETGYGDLLLSTVSALKDVESGLVAAERGVVGAILRNNDSYDLACMHVSEADFSDPISAALFVALSEIIERRIEGVLIADPITVSMHRSVQRLVALRDLQHLSSAATEDEATLAAYLAIVRNASAERSLGQAVSMAGGLLEQDGDIDSKAEAIQTLVAGAVSSRAQSTTSIGAAAIKAMTEMAQAAQSGTTMMGVPTGYEDLDMLTAGLHGGQLIVLGARPGMGKTALALCIGIYAAAHGYHCLMASMEMKAAELAKRAIALVSGVDSHALRTAALTAEQWDRAAMATEYLDTLPFEIKDVAGLKLSMLAAEARKLHRAGRLNLLIVDYLQIMTPSSNAKIREQQISEISRGLKELAMELEVPVIALSQLNRKLEERADRRPMMSDLRESGSLEQDADVIVFVHREDMVKKIGVGTCVAEIIVAKQRNGATGDVILGYEGETTRFHPANDPHFLRIDFPVRQAA